MQNVVNTLQSFVQMLKLYINNMYLIYDDFGDLIRKVRYKAEAHYLIRNREGWTYKFVPKKKVSLSSFEAAPF